MHLTMCCPRHSGSQNQAPGSGASLVFEHWQLELPICGTRCLAVHVLRPQLSLEHCRWNFEWSLPTCVNCESARVLGLKPHPLGRRAIRTEIGGLEEPVSHNHVGNH